MWQYMLYFSSLEDKKAAEVWIQQNVGYFEFEAMQHEDGGKYTPRLKFYCSTELPEQEQQTIRQETRAMTFRAEEM
jgi:hypothetical protein